MRLFARPFRLLVGLSILFVHTVIAVASLLAIQWLLSNPPHPAVLVAGFLTVAVVGALVGYRTGVVRLAASLDARELPERRAPAVYRRLRDLSDRMDIERPPLLIADLGAPNALSVGGPRGGAVILDQRLLSLLNVGELEGIIAHELAHMEGYDTFLNTLALTLVRLLVAVVFVLVFPLVVFLAGIDRAAIWIADVPRRGWGSGLAGLFQRLVGLSLVGLLSVFTLLFLANARRQEYRADRRAAAVTGKPVALARALSKIHRATEARRGLHSLLYIHDDRRGGRHRLFSTHPPLEERIDRLLEAAETPTDAVRIRSSRP